MVPSSREAIKPHFSGVEEQWGCRQERGRRGTKGERQEVLPTLSWEAPLIWYLFYDLCWVLYSSLLFDQEWVD